MTVGTSATRITILGLAVMADNDNDGSSVIGTWQGFLRETPEGREKASTMASTMTTALTQELTATDRCDRCGAQAYIRARLATGGELLFCAHHGRQHLAALQDTAVTIHDESDRLNEGAATLSLDER